MNQPIKHIWKLLLVTMIVMVSCIAPALPMPSVPTTDPDALKTIIVQTAAVASTETGMALPTSTGTSTSTPTATDTATSTLSPTSTFVVSVPTRRLPSPTSTVSISAKVFFTTPNSPTPKKKRRSATRPPLVPTETSSAISNPPVPTDTPMMLSPTQTSTPCSSAFSCERGSLPSFNLPPGGPNNPDFKPCTGTKGFPWISVETEKSTSNDVEQGQHVYYFACEFADPNTLTAEMSGPNGVEPLTVLISIPNPDLQMHRAQRVVVWNALCALPTGEYTLTMSDGQGSQAHLTFSLTATRFQRILAAPYQAQSAGKTFQIYYCGYGTEAGKEVVVDFYYGAKNTGPQGGYDFYLSKSWTVLIDGNGSAVEPLSSLPSDPTQIYLINDHEAALKGSDYIWLTP